MHGDLGMNSQIMHKMPRVSKCVRIGNNVSASQIYSLPNLNQIADIQVSGSLGVYTLIIKESGISLWDDTRGESIWEIHPSASN